MNGVGFREAAENRLAELTQLLQAIVSLESPTNDKPAVDRLVGMLNSEAADRGGNVERISQSDFGDLTVVRWPGSTHDPPAFVMTHIDTVWPIGTLERMPWREIDGRVHGPGVFDMKASVAMMLVAVDILRETDSFHRPIVWMINTEEEIGSPASRPLIELLAGQADVVLCLEPPVPPDWALKTQRKGVGMFTMDVAGRASHAGADYAAGVSAIEEIARQIQWLHGLTDEPSGTTVNVGIVKGGTKRNVVAAHARAEIDLRVSTLAEAERVVPRILNAKPFLRGASVTVSGGLNRPPMERSPSVIRAFERARVIGRTVGLELVEGSTGGGSDGNFTAALGVATIDGLGCPGDDAHADHEHIILAELPKRTALLTALLATL